MSAARDRPPMRARGQYLRQFLEPSYFWTIKDRGSPVRIDIVIVYDRNKIKTVPHRYKGREKELKKDGFVFKHPDRKTDAVLGVIKIK